MQGPRDRACDESGWWRRGGAPVALAHLLGRAEEVGRRRAPAHLELLLAGRASAVVLDMFAGSGAAARLSETLGADDCAVVMTREHLAGALGVPFGGIAASCVVQKGKVADQPTKKTTKPAKKVSRKKPARGRRAAAGCARGGGTSAQGDASMPAECVAMFFGIFMFWAKVNRVTCFWWLTGDDWGFMVLRRRQEEGTVGESIGGCITEILAGTKVACSA